jgi:DNA-directed RNA polymerase specialized sigma24 family protein
VSSPPKTTDEVVGALYRAYSKPLLRFVVRLLAKRGWPESLPDAEGVVHEAFIAMLGANDPIQNPPAWLFTVARRLVSKIPADHRTPRVDPQDLFDTGAVRWSTMAPQASMEDIFEARQVLANLSRLPDRQAAAYYLSTVGWSHAEIGAYLRCAPATAGVHIHRARRELRTHMLAVAIGLSGLGWIIGFPKHELVCSIDCSQGPHMPIPPASGGELPQLAQVPWVVSLALILLLAAAVVAAVAAARWTVKAARRARVRARARRNSRLPRALAEVRARRSSYPTTRCRDIGCHDREIPVSGPFSSWPDDTFHDVSTT